MIAQSEIDRNIGRKMKFIFIVTFVIFCQISFTFSYRILVLYPTTSKSHVLVARSFSEALVEKGHEVTLISPFPSNKKVENFRDIKSPISDDALSFADDLVKNPKKSIYGMMSTVLSIALKTGRDLLDMPQFKKIMKDEKFDLVVIGFWMNNYLLGVGDHFKCPTIMMSAGGAYTHTNLLFGNPLGVSTISHPINSKTGKLNFFDRLKNFILYGFDRVLYFYVDRLQQKIYEEYFPADRYISYDEALKNISMNLVNSHFTQGGAKPYVPAMVEVGGITVKPKADPLPSEIQNFLDNAKDGAILFSFGTNAKTNFLPKEKIEILLNVFSSLKQRVIMKWESDSLEGKPENVFIGKWLPQDDILAHKNVKLFISHCGLGSTVEAKYHGVPILAIPIFGDQMANAEVIINDGWAVKVDFVTLSEKSLSDGIKELLENPKYKYTVEKLSQLYRDRPMNARETATYWVEYVIRHRGATHIQYPGVHLNFWQSNSLDVIGFLIATFYLGFKIFLMAVKFVWRKIYRKNLNVEKQKKRN